VSNKTSYSVQKYLQAVRRLVQTRIPQIWVRGVVHQFNVRGNMVYLSLAELAPDSLKPVAMLSLIAGSRDLERLNNRLQGAGSGLELQVDLEVCLLLEADFYIPQGKFQARIIDIDPAYTLGEMALARQRILESLKNDGLLDKNKKCRFPRVPLNVGLITARDSAALNDFRSVLESSGFAFRLEVSYAWMQGKETENSVVKALETLQDCELDVVCIVRGGGSKADLVWFDSEAICRAIANYPVPVLTGIGHQIDTSLADEVAWANKITPTECAAWLVQKLEDEWQYMHGVEWTLQERLKKRHMREKERLQFLAQNIAGRVPRRLTQEKERLQRHKTGLLRGPHKIIRMQEGSFQQKEARIHFLWNNRRTREEYKLSEMHRRLQKGAEVRLTLHRERLTAQEKLLHSLDWRAPLRRGYAIVRDNSGQVLKKKEIRKGTTIQIDWQEQQLRAEVLAVKDKSASSE
jgi:exodeoxyribonuclease VII large subunit